MKDLTVVIPCYAENVELVTKTYNDIISLGAKCIVVDDGSHMDLPEDMCVVSYPANIGYGYAIKRGIKEANTPYVLTCDGDGQHTVSDIQKIYQVFKLSDFKMVVGQRWNLNEKPVRWLGRKVLNFIASLISGHYLSDLNSGMRMFDTNLAKGYSSILCDTFSFTTSLTMAMVTDGHKMMYFPIDVKPRAHGKSHVRLVKDGLVTVYYIVWVGLALRTRKLRAWIRQTIPGR